MTERREKTPLHFAPAATTVELYERIIQEPRQNWAELMSVLDNRFSISRLRRDFFAQWLTRVYKQTQSNNADWAEERFRQLRREREHWSIDGMLVDQNGETVGASVWSTYNSFAHNSELHFTMSDLIQSMAKSDNLIYPLTPKYQTVLFWNENDDSKVTKVIECTPGDFLIEPYLSEDSRVTSIKMARVGQHKAGPSVFANDGVTLGKLGFWESNKLRMGHFGNQIYVQRVAFRESALLPNGAYISPLDPQEVKKAGGMLMEEKYPDMPIIRVEKGQAETDFITGALAAQRPNKQCPVVLSYTTPRIWLGEGPKHGPGRKVQSLL